MTPKAKKANKSPTVGAGLAKGLLEFAVAKGAPRETLLAGSGLSDADLLHQDARIPFAKYVALMRAGQELAGDPALALHFGEAINLSDMSIVGNLGAGDVTIEAGVAYLNRFAGLLVEVDSGGGDAFTIARENGQTWLVDNRRVPPDFPQLIESAFARMVCWTRAFSEGGASFAKAVEVHHERPEHGAEYERVLRVPVAFGCARNALLIDETWRPKGISPPSRYVSDVLARRAEELLANLSSALSIRGRVEAALIASLRTGKADLAGLAKSLGFSRKTLYRKLKAEGTSYAEVLDDVRRRTALHCLNGEGATINETAYLLGFSDASAFSRAFKRWTGKAPRDWKRQD